MKLSDKDVRISVIGTGRMGFNHARLIARLGYLDSIVDIESNIAEKIGKQFNVPFYNTIEELSSARSPNGIIIAVPTLLHSEMAKNAVNHLPNLKTMLIEKPITSSVSEAKELQLILNKKNIKVIVGHIEVYNPIISRIQDILLKGILGKPRSILFQRRGAISEARIESVGDIYEDIGVHDFDVALRLFPSNEFKIFSTALRLNNFDNTSVIVLCNEKEDFFITFLMSREYAGKVRKIEIEGTKATLIANLLTQILELRSLEISRGENNLSAIRIPFSNGEEVKVYGEPLLYEIWNLIDCIRGTSNPFVSIEDGIKVLTLVEHARTCIRTGKTKFITI